MSDEPAGPADEPPGDAGHGNDCDCGCGDCARDGGVEPDAIVDGIDPECGGSDGLTVFRGFLAQSRVDDLWRLYLSLGLTDYILLRDKDIVAQRKAGGGSLVWVKARKSVRHVRVRRAKDLQAEFLEGEIARRRGATTGTGGGVHPDPGGEGGIPPSDSWECPQSAVYTRCNPH